MKKYSTKRYPIGKVSWCEPDYLQISLWARALRCHLGTVVRRFVLGENNGRMTHVELDISTMPFHNQWVDGLEIEILEVKSTNSGIGIFRPALRYLEELYCNELGIRTLDLSRVPSLKLLHCCGNSLSRLALSGLPDLEAISCRKNQLKKLDFSCNRKLNSINIQGNQIKRIDLGNATKLAFVECDAGVQVTGRRNQELRVLFA